MYEVPRVVRFRDRKQIVGAGGWGKGDVGSECSTGTELQFGKMRKFWR